MIKDLQIRSKSTREIIGLIDSYKSIIWHEAYYGTGDFEVYVQATQTHRRLLKVGNYITRSDNTRGMIGIIEKLETERSRSKGEMLIASGRMAKSILDRRHIYRLTTPADHPNKYINRPTLLGTAEYPTVEGSIRHVVSKNIINAVDEARNIEELKLGTNHEYPDVVTDDEGNRTERQVSYDNLLTFTDEFLADYSMGAKVTLRDSDLTLRYDVVKGDDRSNSVILEQELDNIIDAKYNYDMTTRKTTALVGGEGQDLDRFYAMARTGYTGLNRRETFIDASSINKKYKEEGSEEEKEYADSTYKRMIQTKAKEELRQLVATEEVGGTLNLRGGEWRLFDDYYLGDIVTLRDKRLDINAKVRVVETTETQDEKGYNVDIKIETEEL